MTIVLQSRLSASRPADYSRRPRWVGWGMFALGLALALNSALGPAGFDVVRYSLSESLHNQLVGLDIVSSILVAPLCVGSGALILRGANSGAVLALGPATYSAYMFAQYIVGPGYEIYPAVLLFHLGLFVLSGILAVAAWTAVDAERLPSMTARQRQVRSRVLLGLGAFVVLRYLPALLGSLTQERLTHEFRAEPAFFWSILLMDLGIVVPAAASAAVLVRNGSPSGPRAMYALVGWFASVPPSVAAMSITMVLNDDPFASSGSAALFVAAAAAFGWFAVHLYQPLFRSSPQG